MRYHLDAADYASTKIRDVIRIVRAEIGKLIARRLNGLASAADFLRESLRAKLLEIGTE